ncbi:MAG: glucose 1-dehydrogenase [Chloroflexi bacterium]|nr:glucose 1-dehydrogenase [Chloroflexota bacterium]MYC07153.1 glucose 1-dehydrogenase [Chloroflexota bacterium]
MGRLDGKVALISGGARGQGAAEAMLFAKEGAKVVIGDLLDDEGRQVEAQIAELGGDATYVRLDVTSADEWDAAVQTALERYGRLDILVNNAGILGRRTGIEDTTSEQWDAILDVNAKGVFLGTKAAIPALQEAGGGSIVNISSIAGIIGSRNGIPAYQASKGAVRLLTKSTALQHAADNIRCNSVHPGMIVTAMTEETLAIPEMREFYDQNIPLGRLGTVDDIANGVLFLASDDSSFVTGSELVIDGGLVAQ